MLVSITVSISHLASLKREMDTHAEELVLLHAETALPAGGDDIFKGTQTIAGSLSESVKLGG